VPPGRAPSSDDAATGVARSHVNADGTPKARYGSEREAADVAQLQWIEHRVELTAYRCEICSGWHLARQRP
jgi:hypothetical protein